jgi:hypothetical protein
MGRTYLFECPKCAYRAKVAGGEDRGFHFAVQTLLCRECKELHDAVIALKVAGPGFEVMSGKLANLRAARKTPLVAPTFLAALNRLPPAGAKRFRWVHFKPACPVSAPHRVRDWRSPDVCPKCGCLLERNAIPFRIWD